MKKTFDIANIFSFSWQIYKKNWLLLIGLSFLALVVPSTLSLGASHANPSLFFSLVTFLFTLLIDIVIYTVCLSLVENQPLSLSSLSVKQIISFFIARVLFYLIIMAGLFLLIFPALMWGMQFLLHPYFIIDKKRGPLEALKESKNAVYGHKWRLFAFTILAFLFNLAGLLCFGVGVFITLPITWIGFAKIYVILAKTYD